MSGVKAEPLPDVAILLSVFDGDRFIRDQLDSIGAQRGVAWALYWRDDGSSVTGSGRQAIAAFADQFPGQVFQTGDSGCRLGVGRSYMSLLAATRDQPYVAFADQDDVWLPDKLARAVARLQTGPVDQPALYCGRQHLVDATLQALQSSGIPPRPLGFGNALVQNIATGCTVVLNRSACRAILTMPPPANTMHDWWCYLVVSGLGGRLIYDAEPFILYRQHAGNTVGAAGNVVVRALRALRRGPGPFLARLDRHIQALGTYRDRLTEENKALLDALRHTRALPSRHRLRTLIRAGVYRQGTAEDLLLRFWLMVGRPR